MFNILSFRIGCSTTSFNRTDLEQMALEACRKGEAYIVYEVSDKDGQHIHGLLKTALKKTGFSQFMKKKFPTLGRGHWSIKDKPLDENERVLAERYLSKGRGVDSLPDVFFNTLVVDVPKRHREYWERKPLQEPTTVVIEPVVVPIRQVKKSAPTFLQLVVAELMYDENGDEIEWTLEMEHRERIYRTVMRMLGKKGKNLDRFIVTRLVMGALNILAPQQFRDHLMYDVINSF